MKKGSLHRNTPSIDAIGEDKDTGDPGDDHIDVKNVKSKIRLNQFTQFKILTFFHFHFSFIELQRSIRQDNQI